MRLALDEHYSREIAEQLRSRGHDVIAVTERPDLQGPLDSELFQVLAAERRALVTENWADFQREVEEAVATGLTFYGVVFTSPKQLPRSRNTIGLYVRVLDDFLYRHPVDDAFLNSYHWLPDRSLQA